MKKKLLILAAVAVSGLAAVVASNTNKVFSNNEADAEEPCEIDGPLLTYTCSGPGECSLEGKYGKFYCTQVEVNK